MVNNAGVGLIYRDGLSLRIHETPEFAWDKIMGVNGKGVWLGCTLEYAADRIHVNAIAPGYAQTPLLDDLMAKDSEDPAIKDMRASIEAKQPLGCRMAEPHEVASAALFLASADASFITGHTLTVDGGYLAGK
ncbi:uncharacterized protein GIQ15_02320 [Arthroderma uncinatum]|uniref:uncharacterized protein n=1 Tax=Arthroderma uncinatum TaxID=74035 RepID=UPI00144AF2A3|nr:uncharacterized protein GIQ15_02320 [Arthroderma uncinatum]KAF3482996.1 hypothetical protein GIQ15_02320 [Arthroderma uncinatum]